MHLHPTTFTKGSKGPVPPNIQETPCLHLKTHSGDRQQQYVLWLGYRAKTIASRTFHMSKIRQTLRKEVTYVEAGSFHSVFIFKYIGMSVYVQRIEVWMRHTVCREPAEAAVMITHVSASPGHGLLFHSPTHMHIQPHARILCHTFWSLFLFFLSRVYHFYTKDASTHTHTHPRRSETLEPSRCPSVGVICVTPPLTPVCGSSPLVSRTSALSTSAAGTLPGSI